MHSTITVGANVQVKTKNVYGEADTTAKEVTNKKGCDWRLNNEEWKESVKKFYMIQPISYTLALCMLLFKYY
jgi:hypothetical protein